MGILNAKRPSGRTQNHVKEQVASFDDGKEKRLNVIMLESEYRKLKQFALDQNRTVSDIVRGALNEYMSKYSNK